jgi:GGDEF domain-containing protein
MSYVRFERYAIAIAALVVLSMVAVSARDLTHNASELVAESLMFAVFVAAVHYGRKGGLVAAMSASVIYVLLNVPNMTLSHGLTTQVLFLITLRVLVFGLIGIVGGEACGRLRLFMTRASSAEIFDDWSRVFNQRYAYTALTRSIAAFERYGQQFTLALISLAPSITADLGAQRARNIVRSVSKHLRGDVRMVDEVARLDDGRFLVLLQNTPLENGKAATARLTSGVRQLLGAREESVISRCLSPETDAVALKTLADEIAPRLGASPDDQEGSGAYSSAGASERNPARDSADSAPGASTLKMSTAAAPDGSTKQ